MAETTSRSKAADVIEECRARGIKIVDLKFTDLLGKLQHFSIPVGELTEEVFQEGLGFDGSSIQGFQQIHESDMLVMPDPDTAFVDPIYQVPSMSILCDIKDPITGESYSRDPRHVAKKAEAYLKSTGIAEVSNWGPEVEFFIFDDIRFGQNEHSGYYYIDSEEGIWNSGRNDHQNMGHRPGYKEGYFPVPPVDTLQDLRSEMVLKLIEIGIPVEVHHHEVATAGQGEIDMRFGTLTKMGDSVMLYKYILKNVAAKHHKTVTFMPKPLFMDNGTGMHVHQSLWKDGENLFYGEGYALTSELCKYYIGGLLAHAPALMAFCAPTTNSYKRLVPGFEAPVNLAYSARNRSACIRIPMVSKKPKLKRIEFRPPDPSCNPYLTFSALLMAGLDGIEKQIDPGEPLEKDIYELPPEEAAKVSQVPGSLEAVLDALEEDHEFLLKGNVFTRDLIETWIDQKRTMEVDPMRLRPHPYEFQLYYDV
ncbi:MAG: type I glutamate--ammonia ligase [Chloroflexi bacterium]|nr:type I glutamate--ammonia ligase [Chloroflexota bacterium]